MIYSQRVKKATCIASRAHAGQYDKAGYPYIHHSLHLAESMTDEASTCSVILHDVIENTPITIDELRAEGIREDVLTALLLLTNVSGRYRWEDGTA
ncbi:MAG: hypothetical protein RR893_12165 [Clostridia bacterium]